MRIYCVECSNYVIAKLVTGAMVYPNTPKVSRDKYWMCNSCKNHVGVHRNANKNKLKPLGVIANKELRSIRKTIHDIIDPIWREEKMKRTHIYAIISNELGYNYHTAELKSIEEATRVKDIVLNIQQNYV